MASRQRHKKRTSQLQAGHDDNQSRNPTCVWQRPREIATQRRRESPCPSSAVGFLPSIVKAAKPGYRLPRFFSRLADPANYTRPMAGDAQQAPQRVSDSNERTACRVIRSRFKKIPQTPN